MSMDFDKLRTLPGITQEEFDQLKGGILAMGKSDITYTEAMDRLVMTTVGVFLVEPSSSRQVAELLGLLRKLVQSCLELAAGESDGSTESGYTWEERRGNE